MDADKGINATAVTVPADWSGGPVLVRLHRTPVRAPGPGPTEQDPEVPPENPRVRTPK